MLQREKIFSKGDKKIFLQKDEAVEIFPNKEALRRIHKVLLEDTSRVSKIMEKELRRRKRDLVGDVKNSTSEKYFKGMEVM